jgi:hypothetical protein
MLLANRWSDKPSEADIAVRELECLFRVGFCRSEGLAAAYDDAAVHEAGNGHDETIVSVVRNVRSC